ncbi:MAG: multiheme c-type cytochrome [Myxococcota bacterium]
MLLLSLLGACAPRPAPSPPAPTVAERFGDAPFLEPIDAPLTVALTSGGSFPSTAATCGGCHPDHHAEWSNSTHAHAIRDLQFVAELAKPGQPRWLCLNCHAPTRPQRRERVEAQTRLAAPGRIDALAATPEPDFDPARVEEGVTCAACHVRRDSDGEGLVVGPRGSGRAPHRVRADRQALHDICVRCHSPVSPPISPTLVCWFETAQEVRAGPTPDADCPSCHMPEAERPPAVGAEPLAVRRHLWLGGGVPKTFAGYAWHAEQGWTPGLDVDVATDPVVVTLTDARAAHDLPTGDPERHLVVEARFEAADGAVLARDTLRIGQRWDWGDAETGRVAHRIEDTRLRPGEARRWTPVLAADGATRLVVEVTHVRVTEENADAMARAQLDDALRALWPEAAGLLPDFRAHYPLSTIVARLTAPLDGGPVVRTPTAELLATSARRGSP